MLTSKEAMFRRARILALLEKAGGWCSGEDISAILGISRAAVAKHITALRAQGHIISAATRRGYRLEARADILRPEDVLPFLNTTTLGRKEWRFFETTTSTNNVAALWAMEGGEEGCIVMAEAQTRGKGRKGKSWFTPARGLQFSIILHKTLSVIDEARLTELVTRAVAEAITDYCGLAAHVKMPNDVYLNGRKVSGVLVEAGLRAGETDWHIVGIGCNVNAASDDLPEELREKTTSLLIEAGHTIDRAGLLAAILNSFEVLYGELCGA